MKRERKSVSFTGVVHLNQYDARIIVDDGSRRHTIETPLGRERLSFLEGKLVEIRIKNIEK